MKLPVWHYGDVTRAAWHIKSPRVWLFLQLWLNSTHWGRDKMAAISQTTLSIAFSLMKMLEFQLNFHWSLPKGPINNIPALVQIMAWRRPGDKPISEPVMVSLLTHICVTRPQWVKVDSVMDPLTKGQQCEKSAHDMAFSCSYRSLPEGTTHPVEGHTANSWMKTRLPLPSERHPRG